MWTVGLLLVVVIAAFVALNRLQSAKQNASSSNSIPTALPTATVPPTLTIRGGAVAAIVNDHPISTATYRQTLDFVTRNGSGPGVSAQTIGLRAMNQVIDDELVREYAATHHIGVSSSELNASIQQYRTQFGGEKGFQQWLTGQGLTFASFKSLLAASLLRQKVSAHIVHPVTFAHVRHILIGVQLQAGAPPLRTDKQAKAKAARVMAELQHGAGFAALARKDSDDTQSGKNGGDLGQVYPGTTVPEFDHAAFTLPLNHPALIHTQFGYHIVEVLGRGKGLPAAGTQERQMVEQQQFNTWIQAQVKRASIKRIATVAG